MRAKTAAPAAGWPRWVAAYVLAARRKSATTCRTRKGSQEQDERATPHGKASRMVCVCLLCTEGS